MRINAISPEYSAAKIGKTRIIEQPISEDVPNIANGTAMIAFKSGNPKHIAHIVAEEPLLGFNGGGVGTVVNDYNYLEKDLEKIVKVIPLYNQKVNYKTGFDPETKEIVQPVQQGVEVRYVPKNLPSDHPYKAFEGVPFVTGDPIDNSTDIVAYLKKDGTEKLGKRKVFFLDEVKDSKIDWGAVEGIPVKMYKVRKDENLQEILKGKHMNSSLREKLEFVLTYVDATASMPKQYSDLSYTSSNGSDLEIRFASGWQGQPYAKYNKAAVELMPGLKEKYGIDPHYILCSDGQSMFTMHYAAQKNAAGDAYWQDKFLGGVGHNMNAGYDQPMGAKQAIVNLGATREELKKLANSREYKEAVKNGKEEEFLQKTVLKNFYRPHQGGMCAFNVPIYYATHGYVPMLTTVSEGYYESLITNPLVSAMYKDLVELDKLGRFKGLTNPLTDPNVNPFSYDILMAGYKNDVRLKLEDGSEVVIPKFKVFDKNKCDLKSVREIKRQNKINFLERLNDKFKGAQYWNEDTQKWSAKDFGRKRILAGLDKNFQIYGNINNEYLEKLKKGEDVKIVLCWGRGDYQKGLDTAIDAFVKFADKDPNSIFLMGGPMENEHAKEVVAKFKEHVRDPKLNGRMIMFDGWAPGKDFAVMSDVALLPSRFAPCELSDLEAKKGFCVPIVPNVQGMAQKNFDPSIEKEAEKMDAYKGIHEFFMTEEEALKSANSTAKEEYNKLKNDLIAKIKKEYKGKINEEIPEELLEKTLRGDKTLEKAFCKLKDSVISDEMAACLERALITDRNGAIPEKILANQVKENLTWFGNSWLSKTNKSSGQLYFDYHFNNKGKNITKSELINLDFSGLHPSTTFGEGFMQGVRNLVHENKKATVITGIVAGVVALGGLTYAATKKGWLSPVFQEEKKAGHLSAVG